MVSIVTKSLVSASVISLEAALRVYNGANGKRVADINGNVGVSASNKRAWWRSAAAGLAACGHISIWWGGEVWHS
jgi:hypothetical protein